MRKQIFAQLKVRSGQLIKMIHKIVVILLNAGLLFGLGRKVYLSKQNTFTCGVWLVANEWQNKPTDSFFVFPKQEPIDCPVNAFKERSVVSKSCVKSGKKWASVWNPELGVKGREGDKICQQVADRLNVTSFPNRVFPRGIMLGYFYNMCGSSKWSDTGARRGGENICCENGIMIPCNKVLFQ